MNYIVNVILTKSVRAFDIEYSYLAGEEIKQHGPGTVVIVPFGRGNRPVEAVVTGILEIKDYKGEIPVSDLKKILSIPEDKQPLSREFLALIKWMKDKYICSGADVVKLLMAPGARTMSDKTVRTVKLALPPEEIKRLIDAGAIKRIYHIRILEYLMEQGETPVQKVLSDFSVSASVVNTLCKNGYVEFSEAVVNIGSFGKGKKGNYPKPEQLTEEQKKILTELYYNLNEKSFREYLLHGITGSGKTEIYLNLIQKVIEDGGDAIVLVPEIALTPQMSERFTGRFGEKVALLHSRLTARERYDQWKLIADGKVNVAVGARSAIFAPFKNLRLIVIDEEHEHTYKSESTPKYLAGDIARFRCSYNNCLLLLGSATPSIETYHRARSGEIGYLELTKRATGSKLPEVELIDMRQQLEEGNRSIFSTRLQEEIKKNLGLKQQTILLMNRRGFSSFLLCRECGYSSKCSNCNVSMTYHSSGERLICHYCGYTEKAKTICPECGTKSLRQFGCGTQKVESEIKKIFPGASVIRMDVDTTTGRTSHEDILRRFTNDKIDILVGTQMIAKGHDLPSVTLVGILAADSILNMEDFRASEKTFQLITQAAGRAGRHDIPGRVIIQGYNIDDYAIRAASKQNYNDFYNSEIIIREQLCYPPFVKMAVVTVSGEKDRFVYDMTVNMKNIFYKTIKNFSALGETDVQEIEVLGPARCPVSKINGKYRWRVILKSSREDLLVQLCTKVSDEYEKLYVKNYKNNLPLLSIDVNPVNML